MRFNLDSTIIEVYKQASKSAPDLIWENLFNCIKSHLGFNMAIVSHFTADKELNVELAYGYAYNLPRISLIEYAEVCSQDVVINQSMAKSRQQDGVSVFRLSEHIPDKSKRKLEYAYIHWAKKYGMLDVLACFTPGFNTSSPCGICISRNNSYPDFTHEEARVFSLLIPHLWNAVEINLEMYISKVNLSDSVGRLVVDKAGKVFYQNISMLDFKNKVTENNMINLNFLEACKNNRDWEGYRVTVKEVGFTSLLFINIIKQKQSSLTPAEMRVLPILSKGFSLKKTAVILSISEHTVANHARRIYSKLGISGKHELIGLNKVTHDAFSEIEYFDREP